MIVDAACRRRLILASVSVVAVVLVTMPSTNENHDVFIKTGIHPRHRALMLQPGQQSSGAAPCSPIAAPSSTGCRPPQKKWIAWAARKPRDSAQQSDNENQAVAQKGILLPFKPHAIPTRKPLNPNLLGRDAEGAKEPSQDQPAGQPNNQDQRNIIQGDVQQQAARVESTESARRRPSQQQSRLDAIRAEEIARRKSALEANQDLQTISGNPSSGVNDPSGGNRPKASVHHGRPSNGQGTGNNGPRGGLTEAGNGGNGASNNNGGKPGSKIGQVSSIGNIVAGGSSGEIDKPSSLGANETKHARNSHNGRSYAAAAAAAAAGAAAAPAAASAGSSLVVGRSRGGITRKPSASAAASSWTQISAVSGAKGITSSAFSSSRVDAGINGDQALAGPHSSNTNATNVKVKIQNKLMVRPAVGSLGMGPNGHARIKGDDEEPLTQKDRRTRRRQRRRQEDAVLLARTEQAPKMAMLREGVGADTEDFIPAKLTRPLVPSSSSPARNGAFPRSPGGSINGGHLVGELHASSSSNSGGAGGVNGASSAAAASSYTEVITRTTEVRERRHYATAAASSSS